jgi:hypothetical protein
LTPLLSQPALCWQAVANRCLGLEGFPHGWTLQHVVVMAGQVRKRGWLGANGRWASF